MNNARGAGRLYKLLMSLWTRLSLRRRRQYILLMCLMLASAFAELASLSAILPFLAVLTDPDRLFARPLFARIAHAVGITSARELTLALTITFVSLAILAAAFRTAVLWFSTRIAFATGADLSTDVYRRTLYQPYSVHVARNSSEVISGITSKVHDVVFGVLVPLSTLVSSAVLTVTVSLGLFFFSPGVALVATLVFGTSYGVTSWISRRRLAANSMRISEEQTRVIKSLQEGLGGIRDVLLDGSQQLFCDAYHKSDYRLRRAQGSNVFIALTPRYATEALGMVMIAGLAYALSFRQGGIASALPTLAALALGAQRLLPAMQQGHSAWSNIIGHQASLADAVTLMKQSIPAELLEGPAEPLIFAREICLDAVRFRYLNDGPWVLDGVTVTIRRGTLVGIVGSSGSGKSTMLDLLMGLLTPTDGVLLVDGERLEGRRIRAWQQIIAHVPQAIYLSDATLAENIAFGAGSRELDMQRVQRAARQAHIADFIESCPAGYGEIVGERGVRLSGGQRQRIAIARALYRNAQILIFDEATSALDASTEQSVMEAIDALSGDLTILLIAHRLTTVKRCDSIIQIERGRVVAQGSYDALLERSNAFRELALAGRTS